MRKILGISAFYHDSAAALIIDGKIVAAVQEERFSRERHTAKFPVHAIKYCLETSGINIEELDCVIFYDKPLLKFERLLETYFAFAPKGLVSFLKAIPVWLKEKIFLKRVIVDNLHEIEKFNKKNLVLLFTEHHLSHAASSFFASAFEKSAILTIDGVGEWCTASIGYGNGKNIKLLKEMNFPHSVGLLYSAFTYFLGFTVNSGEYKLMGLAPYGNPASEQTIFFEKTIRDVLVDIKVDGSIWLNQKYFNYAIGLKMVDDAVWERIFKLAKRHPEADITQSHCNLALAIQHITEDIVLKMATEAKKITGSENICLAGGVALNCVANGKLAESGLFRQIYIQPAAGDAGGALGAALAGYHIYFNEPRIPSDCIDIMNGSYLGPDYSNKEIELMCRKVKAVFHTYNEFEDLSRIVAEKLAEGNIIGWFQGRMEFGPRALGNRSILGDPRNLEMQKKINLKIKNREGFRPFAPSVLLEDANEYFELETESPYMLLVAPVRENIRNPVPDNYHDLSLKEKLNWNRSKIQSVTHIDFSARIQTVSKDISPRYYKLIKSFKQFTGFGLLVNTSFNVRGEPIVCSPFDAYRCFMSTELDYLVINDYLFSKVEQHDWQNKEKWISSFKND